MQISIESTPLPANADPSNPGNRVWKGVTAGGTHVYLQVASVSVAEGLADSAYAEFEDLSPMPNPDPVAALYARTLV